MRFIFILVIALIVGCANKAETNIRVNSEYDVGKLFSHDGCTVYRFWDGHHVYYTNCNGATAHEVSCGKNCSRLETVDTVR